MRKIKAALIGAGQRGADSYAPYALKHPEEIEFTAVAEPEKERRDAFRDLFGIPERNCYESWEMLLEDENEAEAVLICTQDREHFGPAMKAIEKGYHILLEKPVSFLESECEQIKKAAETYDKVFLICHVLRYTPFFMKLKELLEEGRIGDLQNIQWIENVGYWHQAHSYVRGNWRDSKESSPMILAKCCHDMDMLLWLASADCTSVSSFGSLGHFKKENAPEGAPQRCLDGCPEKEQWPYYAPRIYIDWRDDWQADVIKRVVSKDTSDKAVMEALKKGPYGRCVYHCDNDVVDHQVVNLEFENGVAASFTMSAFSYECSRVLKFMGTKGEISGKLEDGRLKVIDFLTGKQENISIEASANGHGGGDEGIMKAFLKMILEGHNTAGASSAVSSLQSHKMAFAAEASRINKTVITL